MNAFFNGVLKLGLPRFRYRGAFFFIL